MAKKSMVNRNNKRIQLVAKYKKKRESILKTVNDESLSPEVRYMARLELQKIPRNANPTRVRNRCALTGRGRGTFRMFGLCRNKVREIAFRGEVPGITKASW